MTAEPETAGRPDNLFAPRPGDHGAHGRFDARARPDAVPLAAGLPCAAIGACAFALPALAFAAGASLLAPPGRRAAGRLSGMR